MKKMHINEDRRLNSRQKGLFGDFEQLMLRNSFVDPDAYGPVDPDPGRENWHTKKKRKKLRNS
jgi:hypothetical protein